MWKAICRPLQVRTERGRRIGRLRRWSIFPFARHRKSGVSRLAGSRYSVRKTVSPARFALVVPGRSQWTRRSRKTRESKTENTSSSSDPDKSADVLLTKYKDGWVLPSIFFCCVKNAELYSFLYCISFYCKLFNIHLSSINFESITLIFVFFHIPSMPLWVFLSFPSYFLHFLLYYFSYIFSVSHFDFSKIEKFYLIFLLSLS